MIGPPSWFSKMGGRGEYSKQYIPVITEGTQYIDANEQYGQTSRAGSGEIQGVSDHKQGNFERKPRINKEYMHALLSYEQPDLETIKEQFRIWSRYSEFMVLRKDSKKEAGVSYKAVKMAKRGNDVYAWRINKRLKGLDDVPDLRWFNTKNRSQKDATTSALFITLEFRQTERVDQTWRLIGEDYNRFISAMRKRYGKVHAIRCWEAHKSGYPHIHAILYCENHEFDAFFYHGTWRIQEKRDIEGLWPFGFSDIEALGSLRGGVRYVTKYLRKLNYILGEGDPSHGKVDVADVDVEEIEGFAGLVDRASDLTMALCWATSRRAWSVSRGFKELEYDTLDETSPCITQTGQVDLDGNPIYTWTLVGFWGGSLSSWSKDLDLREYREMRSSSTWSDKYLS